MPLPSLASPSTAQTLPSLSAAMPCGKTNRPAPKFFIVLPSGPSSKMGEAFELAHPASSQRSNAQRSSWESTVTASGCDQGRGVAAQYATNLAYVVQQKNAHLCGRDLRRKTRKMLQQPPRLSGRYHGRSMPLRLST